MSPTNPSDFDAKKLGSRIRQAREQQGMSQANFARQIGRTQKRVSEYENGKRRVALTDLPRFAQVLKVSLLDFFEGELSLNDLDRVLLKEFQHLPSVVAKQTAIKLLQTLREAFSR